MDYKCVTTVADLFAYLGSAKVIAFDFETAPLGKYRQDDKAALDPHKSIITGISFSRDEGSAVYVPLYHKQGENLSKPNDLIVILKDTFFENPDIVKVAHNLAFEVMFLYAQGIVLCEPCYDTMAAAQLTLKSQFEFRGLTDCGLKSLATNIFGADMPDFLAVTGGRHFDELHPQDSETIRYACADSDYTLRLYHRCNKWFEDYLPEHRFIAEKVESPTSIYCGMMKYNGIPIDEDLMREKQIRAEETISDLKRQIDALTGGVNLGANASTKAFKDYLYKDLGLPVLRITEKRAEAADDQALMMLRTWCQDNRPELVRLFDLIQEYRKWSKIKSTYIDGYLRYINSATGKIHPDFLPLGTDTGRFSGRNPNLQNCPRKDSDPIGVRSFIKADPGNVILSLDFSQIELRVGAFYCRDASMLETYKRDGDIHAQTTAVIFHIPLFEAADKSGKNYKKMRTIAKNCNFGVFYGLFPKGLHNTLTYKGGLSVSLPKCEEIIRNLKNGYPELTRWQKRVVETAEIMGFTKSYLGRRRYIMGIRSIDWGKRAFAQRCALNTPIQGTAADILKLVCGRMLPGLTMRPWLRPLMQIHDELVFEVPEEKLMDAIVFIKGCMEQKPFEDFDVPIVAEASVGPDFGKLKDMEV
jgi:DNA polymerase-1